MIALDRLPQAVTTIRMHNQETPDNMSLPRILKLTTITVMAALALSVSGCSAFGPEKPSVFSLKIGDCFNDPSADADDLVSEVEVVTCAIEHDNEIYHHAIMMDESYPGTDGAYEQAEVACAPGFFEFIGFTGDQEAYEYELEYSYFVPTQDSWDNAGDRSIDCFAYNGDASKITGSLKGAAE